jgi:hypothetical protein
MKYTYDENGIRTDAPEWFKRLCAEWDEVRERRNKLLSFLADSEKTEKVSYAQLILLKKQLKVVKEYSDILYVRMSLANDEFAIEKDPVPMLGSPNFEKSLSDSVQG